jgi:hypothetical protein
MPKRKRKKASAIKTAKKASLWKRKGFSANWVFDFVLRQQERSVAERKKLNRLYSDYHNAQYLQYQGKMSRKVSRQQAVNLYTRLAKKAGKQALPQAQKLKELAQETKELAQDKVSLNAHALVLAERMARAELEAAMGKSAWSKAERKTSRLASAFRKERQDYLDKSFRAKHDSQRPLPKMIELQMKMESSLQGRPWPTRFMRTLGLRVGFRTGDFIFLDGKKRSFKALGQLKLKKFKGKKKPVKVKSILEAMEMPEMKKEEVAITTKKQFRDFERDVAKGKEGTLPPKQTAKALQEKLKPLIMEKKRFTREMKSLINQVKNIGYGNLTLGLKEKIPYYRISNMDFSLFQADQLMARYLRKQFEGHKQRLVKLNKKISVVKSDLKAVKALERLNQADHIELGFGRPNLLMDLSLKHPNKQFVGLDTGYEKTTRLKDNLHAYKLHSGFLKFMKPGQVETIEAHFFFTAFTTGWESTVESVKRALKPGGKFIVSYPSDKYRGKYESTSILRALLKKHFEVEEKEFTKKDANMTINTPTYYRKRAPPIKFICRKRK